MNEKAKIAENILLYEVKPIFHGIELQGYHLSCEQFGHLTALLNEIKKEKGRM